MTGEGNGDGQAKQCRSSGSVGLLVLRIDNTTPSGLELSSTLGLRLLYDCSSMSCQLGISILHSPVIYCFVFSRIRRISHDYMSSLVAVEKIYHPHLCNSTPLPTTS